MRRWGLIAMVMASLVPATAASAAAPARCAGGPEQPDVLFTGEFSSDQTGSFVMLPFEVAAGTTAIRAWYCYDQPDLPSRSLPFGGQSHTLDFGLYEPRSDPGRLWRMEQFRGWSGSGFFSDITVSPEGFDAEPDPAKKTPGKTSRGYRPGPIPAGTWAAELGVAAVIPRELGDADGKVAWRVELELERDAAFADEPYAPARYRSAAANPSPGWYAGDFHAHTEHSGDAKHRAPFAEVFGAAFRSQKDGGAGLDFLQVTDHNTDTAWGEFGRLQPSYPGKVLARNTEVTTYRGHVNAPGLRAPPDYRTGPVFERLPDGRLEILRPARPISEIFRELRAGGAVTQINHPTIFDATVPVFSAVCRGCSWEYSDAETGYDQVDSIEVATGPQGLREEPRPGPNPFSPLALDFYEHALAIAGRRIAAVSGSDSHKGGRAETPLESPVGVPATVVYANEWSERAVVDAVRAGHTYVKYFGAASPDLRFEADPAGGGPPGIMGDVVYGQRARFTARVAGGPQGLALVVVKNGVPGTPVPVTDSETTHPFTAAAPASGADRYRLQVQRGSAIEAVSTPIWLAAPSAAPGPGSPPGSPGTAPADGFVAGTRTAYVPLKVRALARGTLRVRGRSLVIRCRAHGTDLRECRMRLRARVGLRSLTLGSGRTRMTPGTVRVRVRLTPRARRILARRSRLRIRIHSLAVDARGRTAGERRRVALARKATLRKRGRGALARKATTGKRGRGALARKATLRKRGRGALARKATTGKRGRGASARR